MISPHELIAAIAEGKTLGDVLPVSGRARLALLRTIESDPELSRLLAEAYRLRADMAAAEVVSIADSDTDWARARNRIDARKWWAGVTRPERYGARVDLTVSQAPDMRQAIAAAEARLSPAVPAGGREAILQLGPAAPRDGEDDAGGGFEALIDS